MQIYPGMQVRYLETVDVSLGAVKDVNGVVIDYSLDNRGLDEDRIFVLINHGEGAHAVCTVSRSVLVSRYVGMDHP